MEDTRLMVRRLFEARIADADAFRLPDVADEVVAAMKASPELLASFVDQQLRSMVYAVGQHMLSEWRRGKEEDGEEVVPLPNGGITRSALERKAFGRRLAWLSHYEQVGDRQVKLMTMRRADCLLAAETRLKRVQTESQYATFLKRIAGNLTGEEAVGDKFKPDELQEIFDASRASASAPTPARRPRRRTA
jgi:hypothetical protein